MRMYPSISPPDPKPVRLYRKAPQVPVYYCLDPARNLIESLKDWPDRPKDIDRYAYYEEFAEEIRDHFEPVSPELYRIIRAYVRLSLRRPRARHDHSHRPHPGREAIIQPATS